MKRKKIVLIEDHHQSYYTWKKNNCKNLTLVHFDAHLDFGFQEIKAPRQILREAKNIADLKSHLEKAVLFDKLKFNKEKLTNIANFIYPAMRDGIIKDFYWVIPGAKKEFLRCRRQLKKMLANLAKQDPYQPKKVEFRNGLIKTKLYGHNFFICCLETLPPMKEEILLDIDLDFLVIDSIKKAKATDEIGRRKIWLSVQELIEKIVSRSEIPLRGKNWSVATISYSVNGGFTPLKFKYLGDEIKALLEKKKFTMPKAALAWQKFEKSGQKKYYREAIKSDSTYEVEDNNFGKLWLLKKQYRRAEKEFKKILYCDEKNKFAFCGMGELNFAQRKYKQAEKYFQCSLNVDAHFPKALFGLGRAQFKLKKYQQAEKNLRKYQSLEPMQPQSHYLLGKIYEKRKDFNKALAEHQRAANLGIKMKRS